MSRVSGGHEVRDFVQALPAQRAFAARRRRWTLIIGETYATFTELLPESSILLLEVFDLTTTFRSGRASSSPVANGNGRPVSDVDSVGIKDAQPPSRTQGGSKRQRLVVVLFRGIPSAALRIVRRASLTA
jgi:hypothetical protein